MGKTSLWRIPRDHFRTLRNARSGKIWGWDYSTQIGIPVALGTAAWFLGLRMTSVDHGVSGISIVSGLLFAVVVFLFQLRTALPDNPLLTKDDLVLVDEVMFNCLWAILWGLLVVFYLVLCGTAGWIADPALDVGEYTATFARILSSIAIAASSHLLVVLAMCLKRIHRAYERIAIGRP